VGFPPLPGGPTADPSSPPPEQWQPARWADAWVLPKPPRSAWQRWGRPVTLLLVTACSVFLAGAFDVARAPGGAFLVLRIREGALLAAGLLSILMAHEMGHYLACRYYGVDATLPHFIPAIWIPVGWFFWIPLSWVGTFGAFIRIRSPIPSRKALFDIGVAGPLAGFAVCLPVLWLGVHEARVNGPASEGIRLTWVETHEPGKPLSLGTPLLFQAVERLVQEPATNPGAIALGPLGIAAWFGLLVTALNLMPIGQLDGGHVTYALLRERSRLISRIGSWACVALVVFRPSWILWAILVRILGRRHPPTLDDDAPVGGGRVALGIVALLVFVLCFVPNPVVVSWRDFFDGVRELFK
jgi:membrane-associated protease RseP (regulator of RpoE activity)